MSASAPTQENPVDNAIESQGGSPVVAEPSPEIAARAPGRVQVIRRNGKVTHFDPNKIMVAMTKAFLAVEGGNAAASSRVHERVARAHRAGRPPPSPAGCPAAAPSISRTSRTRWSWP